MGPTAGVRRRRSWSFAVALSVAVLACVFFLRREASILLTLSSPWRSTDNHSPPGTQSKTAKKLRPYDASRPPRVAVCLTGGIRTMRFTMPSIAHNLVDALQPDRGLRHVFIETTTKPDCLSNLNNLALYEDCLIQFNATRRWLDDGAVIAKLLGSNVSIHIENELRCQHPFLLDQPCCMKDARAMDDCGVGLLGMAQFVRRRLCYKRITDYEALHGENFDLVVFSRSDMHFLEPVPPAETFLRKPSRVYFMTKGDAWADFFFVVPRTLSAAFDEASDNVNTDRCSGREDRDKSPEYVLGPWVEKHMEHQLYPFHGVIVRSETRAECGRLGSGVGNDINSVGRYLDEVNNTLVGIDARCRAVYPLGMPPMVQRHSNSGWYFIVAAVASALLFFAVLLHRRYRSRAAH